MIVRHDDSPGRSMLHTGAESATVWLVFGETARAMTDVSNILPNDIDALRALIATARADHAAVVSERNVIIAERDQLAARNQRLEAIIAEIRRAHLVASRSASTTINWRWRSSRLRSLRPSPRSRRLIRP